MSTFNLLAAGLATISIAGSGVGIGIIFGGLVIAMSLQKDDKTAELFRYALLGFALTEAIALFGLMMSFVLLYTVVS